jgi:mannose-1-phosphate guanylyltransferase
MPSQIVPVIMCGGAGTRLWPISRESMPKQFVPLVGQETTFQQVLARISDRDLFARPIIITSADFRFVVAEQLRERNVEADIVLEPMRRDSGPAVAVAWLAENSGSVNPDIEIINAVRPGLATTRGPLIIASSPYARRGVLWDVTAGTTATTATP